MSQNDTKQKFSLLVPGGTLGVAMMAGLATFAGMSAPADASFQTFRVLGPSVEGVTRLNVGTGEISVCIVDHDGTLSCAVADEQ